MATSSCAVLQALWESAVSQITPAGDAQRRIGLRIPPVAAILGPQAQLD
jgi:hypothetical protein